MTVTARELHILRRAARALRKPKGAAGHQPPLQHGEAEMRVRRTAARVVKRKLKQGRPGRGSNAPLPAFDWEKVVNDSQRTAFRRHEKRRSRDREWA